MSLPDSTVTASALTSARAQLEAAFADVPMSDRVRRVVQASSDTQSGVFTLDGRMAAWSMRLCGCWPAACWGCLFETICG